MNTVPGSWFYQNRVGHFGRDRIGRKAKLVDSSTGQKLALSNAELVEKLTARIYIEMQNIVNGKNNKNDKKASNNNQQNKIQCNNYL